MSAGTVLISGGVLAALILLCIITVLCYCRLQYYCCKCDVSESVTAPYARPRSHCDACSVDRVTGTLLPLTFDPSSTHSYCPTCSPYYRHADVRNGNLWLAVTPPEPRAGVTALGTAAMRNFYTNTHTVSTTV